MSSDDTGSELSDSPADSEEYRPPAKRLKAPRRAAQEQTKSAKAGRKRANRKSYADLDVFDFEESGSDGELAAQAQAADQHVNNCSKCGKVGTLVCCDGCERAYHRSCVSPPLREVPPVWFCPFCAPVMDLDANLERILAARPLEKAPKGSKARKDMEYYVKWRDKAHIHCCWVPGTSMEAAAARSAGRGVRPKLQAFERAQVHGEANADPELVFGVNPAWRQVDRIIAERTTSANGAEVPEVLVKWRQLGYDLATWERVQSLQHVDGAEAALERLRSLQPIADEAEELRQSAHKAQKRPKRGGKASGAAVENGAPPEPEKAAREFKETPAFLKGGDLYPYQLEGLNWLVSAWRTRRNVILADEMGLGKTVQTIAYIAAMHQLGVGKPALVVVPLSTLPNWAAELATWAPHLNVVPLHGNDAARKAIKRHELYATLPQGVSRTTRAGLQARVQFHVLLTTYEMVVAEAAELRRIQWQTLVVDEAHRLRRSTSRLFVELASIEAVARVALSGTPLQNNIGELFQLLAFLDPGKFGGGIEDVEATYGHLAEAKQVEELHGMLRPHLLRRLKADVLGSLPPKKEQIIRVELAAPQRTLYKSLLTNSYKALTGGSAQSTAKNNLLMQLRKCCAHPSLLSPSPGIQQGQKLAEYIAASGKLALLDQMVGLLRERGHRTLIYSQFTMLLDVLEDWLIERQWPYFRLDGNIASQDRQKRIEAFNAPGAKQDVFLLSTRAGGQGINLATADTVFIFDSDWNPHNDMQALARAHRLGQTRPVMIYRLVARSTVEEYMVDKAKGKLVINHVVFSSLDDRRKDGASTKAGELDVILQYGARRLFEEDEKPEGPENGKSASDAVQQQQQQQRKDTMSAREAAAGRLGGGGRRIVYDAAAIEALLDRSGLEKGTDAGDADEPQSDFMKSFKVAEFDYEEEPEVEEEHEPEVAEPNGAAAAAGDGSALPGVPSRQFWDDLLKEEHMQAEALKLAAMGKGKRQRRNIDYSLGGSDEADDDDFSLSDVDDGDSSGGSDIETTTVPEQRARKRQRRLAEEVGGQNKPIVGHLAAIAQHMGVGTAAAGPAAGAVTLQHGAQLPLLPAPGAPRPRITTGAQQLHAGGPRQPAQGVPLGTYLPTGQSVFAQVASSLQQPAGQPAAAPGQQPGQAAVLAAAPPPQVWQPPSALGLPPLKRLIGKELRILDLDEKQRRKFLRTLMYYGIDTLPGGGFDWQRFRTALSAKEVLTRAAPSVKAVDAYGQLLVDLMNAPANTSSYHCTWLGDSVQRQDLLFGSHPQEIMTRLGMLRLIQRKVEESGGGDAAQFQLKHQPHVPKATAGWTQDHDRRLLLGILRHGYGRWKPIVDDEELDLKPQLRHELAMTRPLKLVAPPGAAPKLVANGAAAAGDGAGTASDAAVAAPDAAGAGPAVAPDAGEAAAPDSEQPPEAAKTDAERLEEARKAEAATHARERQWLEKRAMALSDSLHQEYYPSAPLSAPTVRPRQQAAVPPPPQVAHALQQHQASKPGGVGQFAAAAPPGVVRWPSGSPSPAAAQGHQQRPHQQGGPAGGHGNGGGRLKQQNIASMFAVGGRGPALPQQPPAQQRAVSAAAPRLPRDEAVLRLTPRGRALMVTLRAGQRVSEAEGIAILQEAQRAHRTLHRKQQEQQRHVTPPTQRQPAQPSAAAAAARQFKAVPLEPVAGGSAEESAGRRRLGELHNALCNKVLAVRAGARAAHKSAAGAGADAVDAAAQSFQAHMQDLENLAGSMLRTLSAGSGALPHDYLQTAERAAGALLGRPVAPLQGVSRPSLQNGASAATSDATAAGKADVHQQPTAAARHGVGGGAAALGAPTTGSPMAINSPSRSPAADGAVAAAQHSGVQLRAPAAATPASAAPVTGPGGHAITSAGMARPALAGASGGAAAEPVAAATAAVQANGDVATATKPAIVQPGSQPSGTQPAVAARPAVRQGSAAHIATGPAGAAQRRALASPQKAQSQDVIVLTSSSEEDD